MLTLLHVTRERTLLGNFVRYTFSIGMHTDAHEPLFFQILYNARNDKTLHLYSSLNDLDLYSRSQAYGMAGTCVIILLPSDLKYPKLFKASTSRAEDPGFESRLRRDFFGVESYQ